MSRREGTRRRGFALIGVLWIVVLISVVGLDFSLRARGMTRRVINASDQSVARGAAEAGLMRAEDRLVAVLQGGPGASLGGQPMPDPWLDPGVLLTDTMRLGRAEYFVRLEDAGARTHLNVAGEDELRRLMTALRIDAGEADRVAQAIADWRDLDDFRRGRGAERDEYVQADAAALPSNGPFGSVGELRQVLGVTEELYERLAPFLTVAGSGRVNLTSAPAEVIGALPGMSNDLLALILRTRQRDGVVPDLLTLTNDLDEDAREALRRSLPELLPRVTRETTEVAITSEGRVPGSPITVQASAVAVRAADAVFVVDRVVR